MQEDLLTWYLRRRPEMISLPLYRAGKMLQGDWEVVFGHNSISRANLEQPGGNNKQDKNLALFNKTQCLQRLRAALGAVGGPELDKILVEVVCQGKAMEDFEKDVHWRKGSGLVTLRTALYRLAVFQKLLQARPYIF